MADDIQDFLTALSAADVKFVVVGACAMACHGYVRATGDVDVLVEPTPTNAEKLARAIREFADASLEYFGVSVKDMSRPKYGFFMGVEPNRIDVLTRISGVSFSRAWKGSMSATFVGVPVRVLGLDELLAAKRASVGQREAGSTKALTDAADLAWLRAERMRRRRG
jgi:hypothetical protein